MKKYILFLTTFISCYYSYSMTVNIGGTSYTDDPGLHDYDIGANLRRIGYTVNTDTLSITWQQTTTAKNWAYLEYSCTGNVTKANGTSTLPRYRNGSSYDNMTIIVSGIDIPSKPVWQGSTPLEQTVYVGSSFQFSIANFSHSPTSYSVNLSLAHITDTITGQVSGTGSGNTKDYTGTFTATNSAGTSDPVNLLVHVIGVSNSDFHFTSSSIASAASGSAFSYHLSTNRDGQGGVTYTVSGLPPYLSYVPSTNEIIGTMPSTFNSFGFTICASDIELGKISQTVSVTGSTKIETTSETTNPDGSKTTTKTTDNPNAPQIVKLANFDDFNNTAFAQNSLKNQQTANTSLSDIKTGQTVTNNSLNDLKTGQIAANQHLSDIHADGQTIVSSLNDLKNQEADISSKLNQVHEDLTSHGAMPDMSVEYEKPELEGHTFSVSSVSNVLNHSFTNTAPRFLVPLSKVNSNLEDKYIDLGDDNIAFAVQSLRAFELACVAITMMVWLFRMVRTFEF